MQTPIKKILFICSCLEAGKDGVGDYTRKLACALENKGYATAIVAINDRHLQEKARRGKQCDAGVEVRVLRLSSSTAWPERSPLVKEFTDDFNPDWISLQYVPFGFQIKGLPFRLANNLRQITANSRWHIMFHELSVNKNESFKFRLWALLQISIIKSLLQVLKPQFITTNTIIYKLRLEKMGCPASVLPLFSNITRTKGNVLEAKDIPGYLLHNREDYIVATLFGSFSYTSWNLHSLLDKFSNGHQGKKLVVTSLGRMSFGEEYWKQLQQLFPSILFLRLGMQDAKFISGWLNNYTDIGILTTLPELASKSGSFMAFKEHGVPVVCRERTDELRNYNIPLDEALTEVVENMPFVMPARYQPVAVLDEVVQAFIDDLDVK